MTASRSWSRRHVLALGVGGVAALFAGGVAGAELVARGDLPGHALLDDIDGTCSVDAPHLTIDTVGPSRSGTFFSRARHRTVGYTIGFPPGYRAGNTLPLVVMLHGFGGSHATALSGMQPAQAMALRVDGRALPPMAIVTVDGGGGYWHPHPGDDPMGMLVDELIPMCRGMGLGRPPERIGAMGISMGGYGALVLAEKHPDLVAAVAAISPAVWTTYAQAKAANPGAYSSPADFAAYDAVTHTAALAGMPVRVASGDADPFHPGVVALARALPPGPAEVVLAPGCHTGPFFTAQEPPSLVFLGRHLSSTA